MVPSCLTRTDACAPDPRRRVAPRWITYMFGPSSWVRVSQYARVVPRSAPSFAWTGQSPVAQLAERSAVNRRVGGSSPPGGAGHSVFSDRPRRAGHRLFTGNDRGLIVYSNGAVQQLGDLRMDAAPFHVHVLGHRHVCVAEVVAAMRAESPSSSMRVATVLRKE